MLRRSDGVGGGLGMLVFGVVSWRSCWLCWLSSRSTAEAVTFASDSHSIASVAWDIDVLYCM